MATLGLTGGSVFHSNQPDTPDACVTVYAEPEDVSVHSGTIIARFQAILRIARATAESTGEAQARALLTAVNGLHNRKTYDGVYLAAAMSGTTDPITFAPDDNGGSPVAKATTFTVNDYILIGDEILKVTVVSTPNVTASRAALGTTKAAHNDNTEIANITQNPIPYEQCDSTFADGGVLDMDCDDKERHEWAVNWTVRLKP
jgi:hypothetical protein